MIQRQPHRASGATAIIAARSTRSGKPSSTPAPASRQSTRPAPAAASNAQRVQQLPLRPHVVANGNQRKVRPVSLACLRIHRCRPRRPIARTQQIYADHAVVIQIQQCPRREDLRPPRRHLRRPRQRVAHQHRVVARRIQPPIDRVVQRRPRQRARRSPAAGLPIENKVALVSRLRRSAARARRLRVPPGSVADRSASVILPDWMPQLRSPVLCQSVARSPPQSPGPDRPAISRTSSIPTESRTSSGVTPVAACSSPHSC